MIFMNELKTMNSVHLEKYGVDVKRYLTYAEIQSIVDTTKALDSWAERQINIDMCVLMYATDMSIEDIERIGHDALLQSGLIDEVKNTLYNYVDIMDALEYTESTKRALAQIIRKLPEYTKQLEDVMAKNGKASIQ